MPSAKPVPPSPVPANLWRSVPATTLDVECRLRRARFFATLARHQEVLTRGPGLEVDRELLNGGCPSAAIWHRSGHPCHAANRHQGPKSGASAYVSGRRMLLMSPL